MRCQACGCMDTNYYHGHEACAGCGRTNDGDCCQGAPAPIPECPTPETQTSPLERNDLVP